MDTIDLIIAGITLTPVAATAAWSLCRIKLANRCATTNSALAVSCALALGAVIPGVGGCSDPPRTTAVHGTTQSTTHTDPGTLRIVFQLLQRRREDYRGLGESLALVQLQVEKLTWSCPPEGTIETCRGHYGSMYSAINRGLNSLTVSAPMAVGPGSQLGRSIDGAYVTKRHYDLAWSASDEAYAMCQHEGEDDTRCIDERAAMFEPFARCILHSVCLLEHHVWQTDDAEEGLLRAMLDGDSEEIAAALRVAWDSLEPTAQRTDTCDAKDDVIVERVCSSPDFLGSGTQRQVEALCEVWNTRYAGKGYTPPAFLEGCVTEHH